MATVSLPFANRGRIVGTLSCQQDSYLRSLEAEVVSCIPFPPPNTNQHVSKTKISKSNAPIKKAELSTSKPIWLVEFNDSVLFPEGGGQPTDHGTLTPLSKDSNASIRVDFIERQGLRCVIHSPQPLEPGTSVRQEVDFKRRWDLMQQHTGQHLLSAIMNIYDNLQTLGWGMGAEGEMSYVDLPRKPSEEELQEIQAKANDVIQQNLTITIEKPKDANVEKMPDDYDQEKGVVRVIKIGELDNNTCCGTHLQQTSHIGLLLLGHNAPNSGGRCRQYFMAGDRAIKTATSSLQSVRTISRMLSSGTAPEEVIGNVAKMQDRIAALKRGEGKLLTEIASYEIDRVKAILMDKRSAFVHRSDPGLDFITTVAASVKDDITDGNVVVLTSGEGKSGGAVLIIGKKEAVDKHVSKTKSALPTIKGGGKGERWQGKVLEWEKGDWEALKLIVEAQE